MLIKGISILCVALVFWAVNTEAQRDETSAASLSGAPVGLYSRTGPFGETQSAASLGNAPVGLYQKQQRPIVPAPITLPLLQRLTYQQLLYYIYGLQFSGLPVFNRPFQVGPRPPSVSPPFRPRPPFVSPPVRPRPRPVVPPTWPSPDSVRRTVRPRPPTARPPVRPRPRPSRRPVIQPTRQPGIRPRLLGGIPGIPNLASLPILGNLFGGLGK